jgi:hypothetical protein
MEVNFNQTEEISEREGWGRWINLSDKFLLYNNLTTDVT